MSNAITIKQAVEALTIEWDGRRYRPPMLEELHSDVIIRHVVKVLGAVESLSVLQADAELNQVGDGLESSDCLFAHNLLLRFLEYGLVVAIKLIEEDRATIKQTSAPNNMPPQAALGTRTRRRIA